MINNLGVSGGAPLMARRKPAPAPLPTLPFPDKIKLWFAADRNAYTDTVDLVPAMEGDKVQTWRNLVAGEDAIQTTSANRPIFRTGGLNGKSYIECKRADQQFFQDLTSIPIPAGISDPEIGGFTTFCVVENVDNTGTKFPTIFGATSSTLGKALFFFSPQANRQIWWFKDQTARGNLLPGANMVAVGKAPGTNGFFRYSLNRNFLAFEENTNSSSIGIPNRQFLRNTGFAEGYFDGRLYELIHFNAFLSQSEIAQVEAYLSAKYNIFTG